LRTSPDGAHAFTYDNAGNLISETLNGGIIKALEYDATGRFIGGTNGDGETTQYTYNGLGYRVGNTTTRANPNYAYRDSPNAGGSEYITDIDDIIASWDTNSFHTRFDASGKARQDETSTEEKYYTPDFTTGGLRDIMVSTQGLYGQTLTYGIGLISISTVETSGSEPSVQQITATQYNSKTYAHQNRLGGNSYYTDPDGELAAYFEFDAWGVSCTPRPEDANYAGLDIANGFTGYTYDAVIEVYFAQARLYDANNKRFLQTDPVGGSVTIALSFNAYLYCRDDPVNNIDPTGMWDESKGDSHRSPEDQAAIRALTEAYYSATTQAGRDAAHASAEYIRAHPTTPAPAAPVKTSGAGTSSSSAPAAQGGYAPYPYYTQPPTAFSVLVNAVQHTQPTLSQAEVLKTAAQWLTAVYAKAPGLAGVINPTAELPANPIPLLTTSPEIYAPNVWTDIIPDAFRDVKDNLSVRIPQIVGVGASVAYEEKFESTVNFGLITISNGTKYIASTSGVSSAALLGSVYAKSRLDDPFLSSVGANLSISSVSLGVDLGLDDIGATVNHKINGDTNSIGIKLDVAKLRAGVEISATHKINDYQSEKTYQKYSFDIGKTLLFGAITTVFLISGGNVAMPGTA
jgi:RHS repeat-associated protein